jgi:hypothetical protein
MAGKMGNFPSLKNRSKLFSDFLSFRSRGERGKNGGRIRPRLFFLGQTKSPNSNAGG